MILSPISMSSYRYCRLLSLILGPIPFLRSLLLYHSPPSLLISTRYPPSLLVSSCSPPSLLVSTRYPHSLSSLPILPPYPPSLSSLPILPRYAPSLQIQLGTYSAPVLHDVMIDLARVQGVVCNVTATQTRFHEANVCNESSVCEIVEGVVTTSMISVIWKTLLTQLTSCNKTANKTVG